MIYHLQGGFESIQFQRTAEHTDFNRVRIREIDRSVTSGAGILRVAHLLGRGEADAVPSRPAVHLALRAAAEPQKFSPELFHKVEQTSDCGFLLLICTAERQTRDMNVQAASPGGMAEIAHALRLAENFCPWHFVQMVLKCHRMSYKL